MKLFFESTFDFLWLCFFVCYPLPLKSPFFWDSPFTSSFEGFIFSKPCCSIVQMRKNALFALENGLVFLESLQKIQIISLGSQPLHVHNFSHTLRYVHICLQSLVIWESSWVFVFSMIYDVMGDWVAVGDWGDGGFAGHPRIFGAHISVIFRLGHHMVKQALERSMSGRRVRTNVVRWISRKLFGCHGEFGAIETTVKGKTKFVGTFGRAKRNFAVWNQRRV